MKYIIATALLFATAGGISLASAQENSTPVASSSSSLNDLVPTVTVSGSAGVGK